MVTALLLGIGVQRVLLQKKPLAGARDDDIAECSSRPSRR
jgi:hypothetical protein